MGTVNLIKPLDPHVVNILSVYARADNKDKLNGMNAYPEYNRIIRDIVADDSINVDHIVSLQHACAVFAILSPNSTYTSNLSSAKRMIAAYSRGASIDSFNASTYGQNKRKAWRVLMQGIPLNWEAKKTHAFYRSIFDPDNDLGLFADERRAQPVVVDGHMYGVWQLKPVRMNEARVGNDKRYDQIEADIRTAAGVAGVTVSQMQAVCWFTWKRVNRISYDVRELQHRLWIED